MLFKSAVTSSHLVLCCTLKLINSIIIVIKGCNSKLTTFDLFPWQNGSHMYTKHLVTGHYLYNFSYGTDGQLSGLTSRDGHGLQVRRDAHGVPLWLALPGGQVYWLSLSNSGTLRKVSAQGHDIAHITYHGNTGLLATKSDENSWTTVYE